MYPFLLALSFLFFCHSALCLNVTIDDSFGDPKDSAKIVYSPVGVWTYGPDCGTECTAKPNISNTYENGWRDASQLNFTADSVNATMVFNGTGVAVYGILDKTQANPTDLTFTIDGDNPFHYYSPNQDPAASPPFQYNVQFFAVENLPAGVHTLVMEVGSAKPQDVIKSTVLLDYITYTAPDPVSAGKSHTPVIIGVVIGAIAFIVLVAAGIFWLVRRKSRNHYSQTKVPGHTPFLLKVDTRQNFSSLHDNTETTSQGHYYHEPSPTTASLCVDSPADSDMPPQRGVSLMVENQILREVLVRQWARPSPADGLAQGGDLPPYDQHSASSI
ncbi:hypothetical protein C8J56DRAFT_982375 [Mycena floridula]|nr:hypothetical protein C8J56DRAFT_982375 [Mycena floridula]